MFTGQKHCLKELGNEGRKKRVLVIGAGTGGLVSLKTALESGHDATCLERLSDIGGLWNWKLCGSDKGYVECPKNDTSSYPVYSCLVTNTSQFMTMFSDFMPSGPYREFIRHDEVMDYLTDYAKHFNLMDKIKLGCHVTSLDKVKSKWKVTYTRQEESKEPKNVEEEYDFVMICTGAFGYPHHANIPGQDKFKGDLMHSSQVRNGEPLFKDKRVLVLGGAYSGGEMMAMSLNNGAKKLYVSATHRPELRSVWTLDRYVMSKYGDKRPWDYLMTRDNALEHPEDFDHMLASWLYTFQKKSEDATLVYPGDALALTDIHLIDSAIQKGKMEFVGPVTSFDENGAILKDGSKLEDLDVVVCATGYDQQFPFMDPIWPREEQKKLQMFNYTILPTKKYDGLGFILTTPSGFPLFLTGEMQARWFTKKIVSREYDAQGSLYDDEERANMFKAIEEKLSHLPSYVRFNYTDNMPYFNEYLAGEIGALPPDYKQLLSSSNSEDVDLAVALLYGPLTSIQYRIQGLHPLKNARKEVVGLAKHFLGDHFEEYRKCMLKGEFPRSGQIDSSIMCNEY